MSDIYSSRKMEAVLRENIHIMWLSVMNTPDHNTIARFRSDKVKDQLKSIFAQIVELRVEEGLMGIKDIYTDGTKLEANIDEESGSSLMTLHQLKPYSAFRKTNPSG